MSENATDQGEVGELPDHNELLLKTSLYEQFDLAGNWPYVKRFFSGPDIQFDAYCVFCEKDSTFKQYVGSRGSGSGMSTPKDEIYLEPRIIHLEFRCQRKPKHHYYYILQVAQQDIFKIGQYPSIATIASAGTKRFKKVLERNYLGDLNRAIGLFAHGIGAGSFVYLRRIFEHLLIETAQKARLGGDELDGFEGLHMDKKVAALAAYLPSEVAETAEIYSVLSAGIHALTEKQCLALFPVMLASIEYILDGHLAAKKREEHQRDLKRAINGARNTAKNATSKAEQ